MPSGHPLLHPTQRKPNVAQKKKIADCWKALESMGIASDYDKTNFCNHATRIKNLGQFKNDLETRQSKFLEIEEKIEIVEDMEESLQSDLAGAGTLSDEVKALSGEATCDNKELLEEHEADKNAEVASARKFLQEYEFVTK